MERLIEEERRKMYESENRDQYEMHKIAIRMLQNATLHDDPSEYLSRRQFIALEVARRREDNVKTATAVYIMLLAEVARRMIELKELWKRD